MDLSRLLAQSVSWQPIASTNDRDDPTYGPAVTYPSRNVQQLKDLIGKDGEVTTATNRITLPAYAGVKVGDLLNGREVVAIVSLVDYQGQTVGLQALTR